MKKEIKKLWIKALRSGEYKQIRDKLRKEEGFCCLGVLCDLYGKRRRIGWVDNSFLKETLALPPRVMKWAGLKEDDPKLGRATASHFNDNSKYSFKKIADLIEKRIPSK